MQYHKIPKCRVSFMTWSWAFSTYDNNWVPVDWTSIEVPVWTILSYVSWVQWTVYQFNIWNISYTVYGRNWYSWTTKYLEWITIDWVAFTKWTYTITWDTEIDALWVRNGISITYTLSPQPTPTPPPAPILYPSWVLVNKITLNNDWYAAIISFDEWESILVSEQQWYEATWASVSAWTALSADTIITVYLQSLVTCKVVELQSMSIQSTEFTQLLSAYIPYQYPFIKQIQQWDAPQNWKMNYAFYDGTMFHMMGRVNVMFEDQNHQMMNWTLIVAFSTDNKSTPYCSIYDNDWRIPGSYWIPVWSSVWLIAEPNLWNDVYQNNSEWPLNYWMHNWHCNDVCELIQIIYNLATNK